MDCFDLALTDEIVLVLLLVTTTGSSSSSVDISCHSFSVTMATVNIQYNITGPAEQVWQLPDQSYRQKPTTQKFSLLFGYTNSFN